MIYGSVCSGIEAATVAWHPLGWRPQFFSEIEPFPCAVLAHHYPDVPNYGDMTKFKEWPNAVLDVLVGGTPCQSYSVAGLRAGLDDPRGNLMLTYVAIARKYRPKWVVWENVPGVLSSNKGRDFGSLLGLLTGQHIECPPTGWQNSGVIPGYQGAYGIAWRVLDAQFVRVDSHPRAVPQRRRRVFVVGYLGDWRRAAAVLFERDSLSRNPAPSRKAGQGVAGNAAKGVGIGGAGGRTEGAAGNHFLPVTFDRQSNAECGKQPVASTVSARDYKSPSDLIAYGFNNRQDPTSDEDLMQPIGAKDNGMSVCYPLNTQIVTRSEALGRGTGFGMGENGDPQFTLQAAHSHAVAIGVDEECNASIEHFGPLLRGGQGGTRQAVCFGGDIVRTLSARHDSSPCTDRGMDIVATTMQVRRLTPMECERLQGFPDGYTLVPIQKKRIKVSACEDGRIDTINHALTKMAADGPRYKALGNSMATNVIQWIGRRIQQVEEL